jgi:hypothetical protein
LKLPFLFSIVEHTKRRNRPLPITERIPIESAPAWLEDILPISTPLKTPEFYWACCGRHKPSIKEALVRAAERILRRRISTTEYWIACFRSPTDAQVFAAESKSSWLWDELPAVQVKIDELLAHARLVDARGVSLLEFVGETWAITRSWSVGERIL